VCPTNGRYYQIGIVAWGMRCNEYPGVYTNIPMIREWIDQQMNDKLFGVSSYTM
jgi:secreted trypsin-like serine protease